MRFQVAKIQSFIRAKIIFEFTRSDDESDFRMFKNDSLKREASPPAPETSTSVKKSREMTDEERRAVKLAEFQVGEFFIFIF